MTSTTNSINWARVFCILNEIGADADPTEGDWAIVRAQMRLDETHPAVVLHEVAEAVAEYLDSAGDPDRAALVVAEVDDWNPWAQEAFADALAYAVAAR